MSDSPLLRASRELYLSVLAGGAVDVNGQTMARLTALLEEESVAGGRRILAEGEALEHVYFMRYGRVRLERSGAAPWIVEGSAAFGAYEAGLGRSHARSAVALTDLSLMRVPMDAWLALLDDDFELARLVVVEGLRRLAHLEVDAWPVRPEEEADVRVRVAATRGPLGFLGRVAVLASVPMLRAAGVQVLADLAAMLREQTFERGEAVHTRGVVSGRGFIVVDGAILGTRRAPDVSLTFGPGSLVCGASWLGEPQLAWETRATTRTLALVLDAEDWFDMMEEHTQLLHATIGTMALTRESILEELAMRRGPLVVSGEGHASWADPAG